MFQAFEGNKNEGVSLDVLWCCCINFTAFVPACPTTWLKLHFEGRSLSCSAKSGDLELISGDLERSWMPNQEGKDPEDERWMLALTVITRFMGVYPKGRF